MAQRQATKIEQKNKSVLQRAAQARQCAHSFAIAFLLAAAISTKVLDPTKDRRLTVVMLTLFGCTEQRGETAAEGLGKPDQSTSDVRSVLLNRARILVNSVCGTRVVL
jgi:hypothetical protein